MSTNPKDLIGDTKPSLSLIPPTALVLLAKVMELGAKKYGSYNWRQNKVRATVYVDAALRHLLSYFDGETEDRESGVSHLAHVMACAAIVLDAEATGNLIDDRPTAGKTADLIRKYTTSKPVSFTRYKKVNLGPGAVIPVEDLGVLQKQIERRGFPRLDRRMSAQGDVSLTNSARRDNGRNNINQFGRRGGDRERWATKEECERWERWTA